MLYRIARIRLSKIWPRIYRPTCRSAFTEQMERHFKESLWYKSLYPPVLTMVHLSVKKCNQRDHDYLNDE